METGFAEEQTGRRARQRPRRHRLAGKEAERRSLAAAPQARLATTEMRGTEKFESLCPSRVTVALGRRRPQSDLQAPSHRPLFATALFRRAGGLGEPRSGSERPSARALPCTMLA